MNGAKLNSAKRLASSASLHPNIYNVKVKEKLSM